MARPRAAPPRHPMFERWTDQELALLLGYTADYLGRLRRGEHEMGPRFRAYCARILKRSEESLFGGE